MFIVCEPVALGMEHVPFNAALLKTVHAAFPNERIRFFAQNDHIKFIREQLGEELQPSVEWNELPLPPRHAGFFRRLSSDFKTVKFLLEQLDKNPEKDVLLISGIASILWAVKYYTANAHRNKKVQMVLHGDFSTLKRAPRREILNLFYYIGCLKTALRLPGYKRIQHIVLEDSVRDAILKYLPFLRNNLYTLDHPIPDDEYNDGGLELTSPIQFGFLGRATEKKGFSTYLEVASEILKRFPGKAEFHFVGRIPDELRQKHFSELSVLSEMPENDRLSRIEYASRLNRLHFVCLFYNDYYEFCASGALLDSIAANKPIVANHLKLFQALEMNFGDIGYLCEKNQYAELIGSIIKDKDVRRYKRQTINMNQVKSSRKPETLALKYYDIVEQ